MLDCAVGTVKSPLLARPGPAGRAARRPGARGGDPDHADAGEPRPGRRPSDPRTPRAVHPPSRRPQPRPAPTQTREEVHPVTDERARPAHARAGGRVRRLLAEARHDEPMPADVAARLDGVLADLADEDAATRSEPAAGRRPRRAPAAPDAGRRCWSPRPPWSSSGSASARCSATAAPATRRRRRLGRRAAPSAAARQRAPSADDAAGDGAGARGERRRRAGRAGRGDRRRCARALTLGATSPADVQRRLEPTCAARRAGRPTTARRAGRASATASASPAAARRTATGVAACRRTTTASPAVLAFRAAGGRHPGRRPAACAAPATRCARVDAAARPERPTGAAPRECSSPTIGC